MGAKDRIPGGGILRDEEGIMNPETTEKKCPHCASDEEAAEGASCCGGEDGARHTVRSEEARRKLVNRLSRIEGQIRGIRQMIERDAYCNDVLVQSAAAGAALNAFNRELIGCHMRSCVARDLREGNDAVIDELIDTLAKLMK